MRNWIIEGYEDNVAVPHMERPPCQFDDVIFPAGLQSKGVLMYGYRKKIKSFRFGNEDWTNDDLAYYLNQDIISSKSLL